MKCNHCDSVIPDDSVFCEQCGERVADESPVVKNVKPNPNIMKITGCVVCAIIFIFVIIANIDTNNPHGRSSSEGMIESIGDSLVAPVEKIDSVREQLKAQGWVDLGLPSGTLWKNENEEGTYTYFEAKEKFNDKLPSEKQIKELIDMCQWKWNNDAYEIIGPNGNSILMSAEFVRINDPYCNYSYTTIPVAKYKGKYDHNTYPCGEYWTSEEHFRQRSPNDSAKTLHTVNLYFDSNQPLVNLQEPTHSTRPGYGKKSVRIVK